MVKQLHPLNALRAFEAAGRHLSFVRSSEELHVTPAAVSHQVKGLEDILGLRLFLRLPRGLLLTDAGQQLLPDLRDCFARIDRAMERVREIDERGPLTISVAPAFASKWLVPRLGLFGDAHSEIDLRISAGLSLIDFQRDAFDAAIRLGSGDYPGLEAMKLFEETMTPMCSPRLLNSDTCNPNDLRNHTLLHDESLGFDAHAPTWATWLKAAQVTGIDSSRGPRFSHPDHALQAAIDGAGVALGWCNLAAADLEAGRLVAPFALSLPLGLDFYLVYPEGHGDRPKVAAFKEWLLSELGRTSA